MPKAPKPAQNVRKAQRGIMTTDGLLSVTNWIYLLSLFVAAMASVGLWRLSIASGEEKDRQLDQYKTEAAERIAGANANAEGAKADAARANERAAVLEKEAERFRARSLELELQIQKIGPRTMTELQSAVLSRSLKSEQLKPLIRIDVFDDGETLSYAQTIADVITGSGLVTAVGNRIMAGGHFGILIMDRSGALQRAFRAAGIDFVEAALDPNASLTVLSVGRKPPG
ncbi:hypothetical protein [Methylobacterium trifolii]|uniref:DUF881 domain-containing protein n=1 Tax=Methylobacterium trifolii TaxID=1003092 RepID=A0ABQ4U3T2_9HYPH|nr:hypothetical protein [Methylobacterium trifolii]GJE61683.1 hypothetical protein MPOCJGCO_3806 [Methylobacterium trifolii]